MSAVPFKDLVSPQVFSWGIIKFSYKDGEVHSFIRSSYFFIARAIYSVVCFIIIPGLTALMIYTKQTHLKAALIDLSIAVMGIALVCIAFKLSVTIIPVFNQLSAMIGTAPLSKIALTTGNLVLRSIVVALPVCMSLRYAWSGKIAGKNSEDSDDED